MSTWTDLRYGARLQTRHPGSGLVIVTSLALGIAASTTIFSLFNALLLKPLPGRDVQALVTVYTSDFSGPRYGASSYPDFADIRSENEVFSGLAAYRLTSVLAAAPGGDAERVPAQIVSASFFDVLGTGARYGRTFVPAEDEPDTPAVVVLGHAFWQRSFGGDPSIVGSTLRLNGRPFTIVGVADETFAGLIRGRATDVWLPMGTFPTLTGRPDVLERRGNRGLSIVGRLRDGVEVNQARANLEVIAAQLYDEYAESWVDLNGNPRVLSVLGEADSRVPPQIAQPLDVFMTILMVAVALVLIVACANAANLLLARSIARAREMALRLSLGATRWRLARQVLAESMLLATLAGAIGVVLAWWALRVISAYQPPLPFTIALDLSPDLKVLIFTVAVTMGTGVVFGLAPALQATRIGLASALHDEAAASAGSRRTAWLRATLLVGQVAVSLLLLVSAGLLLRSLAGAGAIDPGFEAEGVTVASVDLEPLGYSAERGQRFFAELRERLRAHPGVEAVSATDRLPLSLGAQRRSLWIEDYTPAPGEDMEHYFSTVGPGFFEALRMRLVSGRSFTDQDAIGARRVVIVNEAFVRRFWPGRSPLGRQIGFGRDPGDSLMDVVGVVRDGKYNSLGEAPTPYLFYPHRQQYAAAMTLLVRSSQEHAAPPATVRQLVGEIDPNVPVFDVMTLADATASSLAPVRIAAALVSATGVMALILAAIGVYGVVSYTVSRRTREFGLRMALGASPGTILRSVVLGGLALAGAGIAIGLCAAFWLSGFLRLLLIGTSPHDLLAFGATPAVLLIVAVVACLTPAVRAMRVDPMVALRME